MNRVSVESFFMYSKVLWFTNGELSSANSVEKPYYAPVVLNAFQLCWVNDKKRLQQLITFAVEMTLHE